jgi:threonine/homoserine/homoserine lactone efflux protein
MLGTQNLLLFIAGGVLLNLTPGQDTFYILGRSIAQGRRAGVISVFGITSGTVVHTCAAAFGLSAILATSANAFFIVKMAGAIYLTYLGLQMLFHRTRHTRLLIQPVHESDWSVYRAGFLSNLLNPKVALFFMAFLPQFVAPSADFKILTFLFLGALFMTTGTIWCLVLAWFGATMSHRLRENPSAASRLRRVSGAMFIGLGVKLAVSK